MKIEKLNEKVDWKVVMEGNNSNIDRIKKLKNLQVDIPPVMSDALEDNEKFDKNSKEVFTKLSKDAKSTIPENPGTGKKIVRKPYTEKLTLDEKLFKESWTSFGGSWRNQTVKKVNYEEEDISDVAEELMNWYGEYFEGWEGPDIKAALYGLNGERIPGSDCPIIFTMEESDEDGLDDEEYDESLKEKKSSKKKKHLCESSSDGWDGEVLYDVTYILDKLQNINYEISSCVRGAYSHCKTYSELGKYLEELGNNLSNLGEEISEYEEDSDDEDVDESLNEAKSKQPKFWNSIFATKVIDAYKNGKLTMDNIDDWETEYNGGVKPTNMGTREILTYHMNTGKDPRNESLEKKSLEDLNLLEYVDEDEVEEDEYTVYDLLNDRLFGYGINKSNFRQKWKFAEVEPTVKTSSGKLKRGYFYPTIHADELVTGKPDDRRAFVDDGVGVFVHDDEEATLAKKCAEELKLDFDMKKLVRPVNGFNYIAVIKVPDEIQEMPVKDYVESIGKSMKDFLRGRGEKPKADFAGSANYSSRKANKESEE